MQKYPHSQAEPGTADRGRSMLLIAVGVLMVAATIGPLSDTHAGFRNAQAATVTGSHTH